MNYPLSIWLMFFFCYCFLGWIWESCYVSLRKRHWINRGFLHGPWLPIYGFGAIIILFLTLPFKNQPVMIYLTGMLGATILEYVTGAVMEKLFHTRYWDYSHQPFNLHGYICLGCSLGWGVFSLLLVKIIHRPIEKLIFKLPANNWIPVSFILMILFVIDAIVSVKEAIDFKVLLARSQQISEQLQNIQKKLESFSEELASKEAVDLSQNLPKWREAIVIDWENRHQRQLKRIDEMQAMLQEAKKKNQKTDFYQFTEKLNQLKEEVRKNSEKKYRRSLRIIWRNPHLFKTSHPDLFEQFFNQKKKDHPKK